METTTEENIRIIFGLKLKKLRSDKKLSLQQLSDMSGVSVSYMNEIENGKKYPKPDKITELAKALETTYDSLVSLKINKITYYMENMSRIIHDSPPSQFIL